MIATARARIILQDQLSKVAASVPGVICSFRLHQAGTASLPYASPVFESIYGLSHDEVRENFSPVFDRIHPDDIGHVQNSIAESAHTLMPWQDSFRYQHPGKSEIWLEGHSIPLIEKDGGILWHGYFHDVTERKRAETALRDSEEYWHGVLNSLPEHVVVLDDSGAISAVNEAWERFALESDGSPCDVSVGANYLDVCRRASAAGNPDALKMLAGLGALFAGQLKLFMMEYQCPTPTRNLWFLMAETIIITTQRCSISPDMAQVTVCDRGTGTANNNILKDMFKPFYTTKPTGLGMGLTISRALIQAHGGKMWVEPNVGSGISVHFALPFVK